MEWLSVKMRNMGLRRFYILVSALSLLTALLCTAVTFWVCIRLREQVAPAGLEIEYDLYGNPVSSEFASPPSAEQWRMANLIQSVCAAGYLLHRSGYRLRSGDLSLQAERTDPDAAERGAADYGTGSGFYHFL